MKAKTRLASKVKNTAVVMAADNEARARDAEADIKRASTDVMREDAQERAIHYWAAAANWHATATRAEEISPAKFTAPNKGLQLKTVARLAFVGAIAADNVGMKRQMLASTIWDHPDVAQYFETWDAVYRFLGQHKSF